MKKKTLFIPDAKGERNVPSRDKGPGLTEERADGGIF